MRLSADQVNSIRNPATGALAAILASEHVALRDEGMILSDECLGQPCSCARPPHCPFCGHGAHIGTHCFEVQDPQPRCGCEPYGLDHLLLLRR